MSQKDILDDVAMEREQQNKKWGLQSHPDVHPNTSDPYDAFYYAGIRSATTAKAMCDYDARNKNTNWAAILVEEVAEAIEEGALKNKEHLRAELVQVAAVAVAWIENIDRDTKGS